jgi:hypothetical protein
VKARVRAMLEKSRAEPKRRRGRRPVARAVVRSDLDIPDSVVLLACPFCGAGRQSLRFDKGIGTITCDRCTAYGPGSSPDVLAAAGLSNRRQDTSIRSVEEF